MLSDASSNVAFRGMVEMVRFKNPYAPVRELSSRRRVRPDPPEILKLSVGLVTTNALVELILGD
jgi:hypothetical protein